MQEYIEEAMNLDDLWERYNDLKQVYPQGDYNQVDLLSILEQIMSIAVINQDIELKLWVAEQMYKIDSSEDYRQLLMLQYRNRIAELSGIELNDADFSDRNNLSEILDQL